MFQCTCIKAVTSESNRTGLVNALKFSDLGVSVSDFFWWQMPPGKNKRGKTIYFVTRGKSKTKLEQIFYLVPKSPGYIFRTSNTANRNGNFLHKTKQEAFCLLFCCQVYNLKHSHWLLYPQIMKLFMIPQKHLSKVKFFFQPPPPTYTQLITITLSRVLILMKKF